MKRKVIFIAVIIILISVLAGCSSTTTQTATSTGKGSPVSVVFNEKDEAVVTHKHGRTVVPKNPQRIISIQMEDFLLALDVKLLASRSFDGYYLADILKERGIETFTVNEQDNVVNYETILSYKPDLIIVRDNYDLNTFEQLSKIAPTVVLNAKTKMETMRTIGAMLHKAEATEGKIAQIDQFEKKSASALHAAVGDEKVAMLRILDKEIRLYPYSTNDMSEFLYATLKLQPDPLSVEFDSKDNNAISMELLPKIQAEHIFLIVGYGSNTEEKVTAAKERYEKIKNDPLWQSIPAVQKGHVYEVSPRLWLTHGILSTEMKTQEVLGYLLKK